MAAAAMVALAATEAPVAMRPAAVRAARRGVRKEACDTAGQRAEQPAAQATAAVVVAMAAVAVAMAAVVVAMAATAAVAVRAAATTIAGVKPPAVRP